jgi:hypothetical protein
VLAIVVTIAAILILGLRLRYGVDLLDESYYAAGSLRFALGMRPLVDDLGAHQFASYLVSPLVRIWLSTHGNLDGVILFLRIVYFVTSIVGAAVAFAFLRKLVSWPTALLSAAVSLGLVPLLIFAPSYNTIAIVAVSIGTSLAGMGLNGEGRPWLFALSGASLAVAAIAYPTFAIAVAGALLLLAWLSRAWKPVVFMVAGIAPVAVGFLATIRATPRGISDFVAFNSFVSQQTGWLTGVSKLAILSRGAIGATYLAPAAWLLVVIAGYRIWRGSVPVFLTALLPIAVLVVPHVQSASGRTMATSTLVLISVLVTGLGPVPAERRRPLYFVLGVGTCAAGVFAYTSAGGFFAFGYGAAAVAAPCMAILLNNASDGLSRRFGGARAVLWTAVLGSIVVSGVVAMCWEATYSWEPSPPLSLHANGVGAYAGLLGEQNLTSEAAQMRVDLAVAAGPRDNLFVYGPIPSAYILSLARPVAPSLWMSGAFGTSKQQAEFIEHWVDVREHRPSVVLVDSSLWNGRSSGPHDYLLDYFDRNFATVVSRSGYVILRKR